MRIAVTGLAGFVGTYVMRELLSHGHEAVGVDIRPPAQGTEADTADSGRPTSTDPASLLRAFEGARPSFIWRQYRIPGIVSPEELFRVNVLGTFNALEAAVAARGSPVRGRVQRGRFGLLLPQGRHEAALPADR